MPSIPSSLSALGLGAVFTAILAGWEQVKSLFSRLAGVLIVTVEFDGGFASAGARIYALAKLRSSSTSFWHYVGHFKFIRPWKKWGCVMYEMIGTEMIGTRGRLYWKGRLPIWISVKEKKDDKESSARNAPVTFRFLRGTFNPDWLAQEVASHAAGLHVADEARFRVVRLAGTSGKPKDAVRSEAVPDVPKDQFSQEHRLIGWQSSDFEEAVTNADPVERLALTDEAMNVVEAVRRWFKSKDWYADRQIPWRFGVLLQGKPGTGKSSLAKALAQSLDVPLVVMDIATMDNQEFHNAYQKALSHAPAMVLIEDIDAVFHGRENVAAEKGKGLTYDCLLNTVSGVEKTDGILLVVTTNNLDQIDPALGVPQAGAACSRPGRIDRVVVGRYKVARRILAGCHESWVEHLVRQGANDTGAQFEDRCATQALALYWSAEPTAPAPRG